jgi:hypothetical protein
MECYTLSPAFKKELLEIPYNTAGKNCARRMEIDVALAGLETENATARLAL